MRKRSGICLLCTLLPLLFIALSAPRSDAIGSLLGWSRSEQEVPLSADQLRSDFGILRESLEEGHAGLYRYRTKREMDARFAAVEVELDRPMPRADFLKHVASLISYIGDGHTGWRASRDQQGALREAPIRPPFLFHFRDDRMYIHHDYREGAADLAGAEVLTINDIGAAEVVGALCDLLPGDGRVMSGRRGRLRDPANFGSLHALHYGQSEEWRFTVREAGAAVEREVNCQGLTATDLLWARNRVGRISGPPAGAFRIENGVGFLTIGTFGGQRYGEEGESFEAFLRGAFRALEQNGVTDLVIDMRDNGGGRDEYGKYLVAYLLDEPFMYYDRLEMRNERFEFLRHTNMAAMAGERIDGVVRDEQGRWLRTDHPNLGLQQPLQPHFGGQVFALVNGGSFSATGEVASVLRVHDRAVFIGEETGAGRTGNTSGMMVSLTLPESGIGVTVPMIGYYMPIEPGAHPERGILPDHEVVPTIEQVLAGRDPVMDRAVELARLNPPSSGKR